MKDFKLIIDSGIESREIRTYFDQMTGLIKGQDIYQGDGWQVHILPMAPRQHGVICLPRTQVIFRGNQSHCEIEIMKFRRKFMRGGG